MFFLLANPCILFQRVCVLYLRSQCVFRCSLYMSVLCVCMRDVISEFNSLIVGSLAFCALMLFLFSILCLICSGRSLHVECILTFGMLCLFAWRMMFVKMVFAGTKRIQPARGWCTTVKRDCANCIHLSPGLSEGLGPHFLGEASDATPQHDWRSSLRETLSPIQDQTQH